VRQAGRPAATTEISRWDEQFSSLVLTDFSPKEIAMPHETYPRRTVALLAACAAALSLTLAGCARDAAPGGQSRVPDASHQTLHTVQEIEEAQKLMRADPGRAVRLYCAGDVVAAQKIAGGLPGCTSGDCRTQWVTTPPQRLADWCIGQVCPLNATTWYPVRCHNLFVPRCEVMLGNISACK
jgi:hypothetical protein